MTMIDEHELAAALNDAADSFAVSDGAVQRILEAATPPEAARRGIRTPTFLHRGRSRNVLVAAALSAAINISVVVLLVEEHHDLSMRSALVHALGDALSAVVVGVAGLIALVASGPVALRVDPIASLLIAAFIVIEGIRLTAASLQILFESVPPDIDLGELRRVLCSVGGIDEVHDLHVWSLDSEHRAMSAHLVVEGDPSIAATKPLLGEVRRLLREDFRIEHATVELESGSCADERHHN